MKEIGGFFALEDISNKEYHKNAIKLNTATNALIYLIKTKKIKRIYVPLYMCDCIDKVKNICTVEYYNIKKDFSFEFNKKLEPNEYLYVVNYYGLFNNYKIKMIKKAYKNVIIDNVQAFFQRPVKNVDTIYSCRKFFGVTDGAYLYTNEILNEEISTDISKTRFEFLLGRLEETAETNYEKYKENEEILSKLELAYMSKSTQMILSSINYKKVKNKRTKNFKFLNSKLKFKNKLKLKNIYGAYMYPYYTSNAEKIREYLIENKIFIPILWPNVLKMNCDEIDYKLARNILPIPCDQRYDISDMKNIIELIKQGEKNG